jgi:hypothetical protein
MGRGGIAGIASRLRYRGPEFEYGGGEVFLISKTPMIKLWGSHGYEADLYFGNCNYHYQINVILRLFSSFFR